VTGRDGQTFVVDGNPTGTVLAMLRHWLVGTSWSAARKLLQSRRVQVNGVLCLDEARRLAPGDRVQISPVPWPPPPGAAEVVVRFVDRSLLVVEKPAGMITLRPKVERSWSPQRRRLQPTLDEVLPQCLAAMGDRRAAAGRSSTDDRLLAVHRIDRDTSGLLVFARNAAVRQELIRQFARHKTVRRYLALIPGEIVDQTLRSQLVRDRGDGLRGSTSAADAGQTAITHVRTLRGFHGWSELECRLETGRTNQIRIHLAELGHPICGDIKYRGPLGQPPLRDESGCRRLALHAAELQFTHPETAEAYRFQSPWPGEMQRFIERLARART